MFALCADISVLTATMCVNAQDHIAKYSKSTQKILTDMEKEKRRVIKAVHSNAIPSPRKHVSLQAENRRLRNALHDIQKVKDELRRAIEENEALQREIGVLKLALTDSPDSSILLRQSHSDHLLWTPIRSGIYSLDTTQTPSVFPSPLTDPLRSGWLMKTDI